MTAKMEMAQVTPPEWLQATANFILVAEKDILRRSWNVSDSIVQVRDQMAIMKFEDLRAWLGLADALVTVADQQQDSSLLDYSLIGAAQVLERDVLSRRFAIVGMMMLLSPPLAHADTFRLVCQLLGKVPSGASG